MNRVRDFGPTGGVGMHEARVWQRRLYSGLVCIVSHILVAPLILMNWQVNLSQVLPADIGVAAAYEAYRYWKHHNRVLFAPLSNDVERTREGFVGLALAEGSLLRSQLSLARR